MADEEKAEAEAHQQYLGEMAQKGARAASMAMPAAWPVDENGKPMGIVIGMASELVPTVRFGNVQLGPAGVYLPVSLDGLTDEALKDRMREVQKMAQYVLATERTMIQWALDPSKKVEWEAGGGAQT